MKSLFKIFVIQIFILFFCNQLMAGEENEFYDSQAFREINSGCKNMGRSDLRCAPLSNDRFNDVTLEGSWLAGASFRGSELQRANLKHVKAERSSFRWANLKGTDLSHSNFTGALFYGVNLKDVKAFEANFDKVTGLTNEDKAYLREQGAIKVPEDLTDEEFEQERLQVEEECRCIMREWVDYLCTPIIYPIKKLEEFVQLPLSLFIKGIECLLSPALYPIKALDDLIFRAFSHSKKTKI